MDRWYVGLDAWIVQDGNYGDFGVGDETAFALEFAFERWEEAPGSSRALTFLPLPPARDATARDAPPDAAHVLAAEPLAVVVADVVAVEPLWIVDCGIRAYSDEPAPDGVAAGSVLAGGLWLGVDPFTYFEQFARDPAVPPLIYRWRVEEIWRETTPWVETAPRYFERDRSRRAVTSVRETNAWDDDGGYASYVLGLSLLDPEPARRR